MNRGVRKLAIVCAVAALLAVGANQVLAQDEAAGVYPIPYWYVISHEICPKKEQEYSATMTEIIAALKQHENANNWMTYGTTTGGPKVKFFYLIGMEKVGDFDDWTEPTQALVDVLGAEEALEAGKALGELTTPKVEIWAFADSLSIPEPVPRTAPAERATEMRVKVPAGRAPEFAQTMQKFVAAYQEQAPATHWFTSRCIVGNEGLEYSIWVNFDKFAELDARPQMSAVMAAAHGEEATAGIFNDWVQLTQVESRYLQYVPELSNPMVAP
jgi:hypothetical protein